MRLLVLIVWLCLGCVGSISGEKLYGVYDFGSGMVVTQYDSECSSTKNISYFSDLFVHVGNKCAFDQDKGIVYVYAQNSTAEKMFIYGVSLTTGEILSTAPPPENNPHNPQMAFDSNSGQLIFTADDLSGLWRQYLLDPMTGIGKKVNSVNASNFSPFLGTGSGFDPINSIQWIPAENWSSWDSDVNGLNAYSPETNTMYSVLDNGSSSLDYFLVGIDFNTGATKSAVYLSSAVWPWCLGYVSDLS